MIVTNQVWTPHCPHSARHTRKPQDPSLLSLEEPETNCLLSSASIYLVLPQEVFIQERQEIRMPVFTELTFSRGDAGVLSAPAAMTRDHRLSGLNHRHSFLTALKTRSPRSGCRQGWFLVKPVFLARRWLPSHCVLWVAFPLDTQKERDLVSLPFFIRPPLLLDQGPTLMTSFNLESESVSHSVMPNSVTPRTVAHQAPLSMGFSRQEY